MFTHIATTCFIYLQFVQIQSKSVNETEIKVLEAEKQEVLKQINEAIKDSVKVLEKANDSQSLVSLNYIKELKDNIKELKDGGSNVNKTARRTKDINMHIFEMFELPPDAKHALHNKGKKGNKARLENQEKMQVQIDEWLANREKERERIKKLRESLRTTKPEKCPNFGKESLSRKKRRDRDRRKSEGRVYPCCRKCCKKSYMGCL